LKIDRRDSRGTGGAYIFPTNAAARDGKFRARVLKKKKKKKKKKRKSLANTGF